MRAYKIAGVLRHEADIAFVASLHLISKTGHFERNTVSQQCLSDITIKVAGRITRSGKLVLSTMLLLVGLPVTTSLLLADLAEKQWNQAELMSIAAMPCSRSASI